MPRHHLENAAGPGRWRDKLWQLILMRSVVFRNCRFGHRIRFLPVLCRRLPAMVTCLTVHARNAAEKGQTLFMKTASSPAMWTLYLAVPLRYSTTASCSLTTAIPGILQRLYPEGEKYGYVLINCKLTGDAQPETVYLGRPWRDYGRIVYNTYRESTSNLKGGITGAARSGNRLRFMLSTRVMVRGRKWISEYRGPKF